MEGGVEITKENKKMHKDGGHTQVRREGEQDSDST